MNDPDLPFEPLVFEGDTYTFSNFTNLVLFTDEPDALLNFNQFLGNVHRCTFSETPCGGAKNVRFLDMFPGSISIEVGKDCYLKSSGGHVGKVLSAGQLAESQEIITSDSDGIAYRLANGEVYQMQNGDVYLVTPPKTIVSKFSIFNPSSEWALCILSIRCPDHSSIKLYNLDTKNYEMLSALNIKQTSGTVNSFSFNRMLRPHSIENLQLMIGYDDLSWTYEFGSGGDQANGLWNLKTFLAFYDPTTKDVYYLLFTKVPDGLTCSIDEAGNVTELIIPRSNHTVYFGKMKYALINQTVDGVPTCFIPSERGSLAEFLKRYFAVVDIQSEIDLKTYVVPAISDDKILPSTVLPTTRLSNLISCQVCPNEYRSESFVLRSDKDVTLTIEASDLVSGENTISASAINIRYVDCWYQAGCDAKSTHKAGKFLTPELLTYDPELVRTNCDEWETWNLSNPYAKNELKLQDGSYIDITTPTNSTSGTYQPTIEERPVYDAETLQPLHLKKDLNRQIWLTILVPDGSEPGIYRSTISIKAGRTTLKTIMLSVEVLDIELLDSENDSIYYRGKITSTGAATVSSETKSEAQFLADHINMVRHGIKNPQLMTQTAAILPTSLAIRAQCGISNADLFYNGYPNINASLAGIESWNDTCVANGVTQLYIYGVDESDMSSLTSKMTDIHNLGVKIYCSQSPANALAIKDYLDVAIGSGSFTADQILEFKSTGHDIYSYGNPQTVPEYALTFRRNYGLYLWQLGYKGAFPYAWQHSFWDIWNDFDDNYSGQEFYRDHCFTYPAADKPIDTIQYEGFAAGIIDRRYMATLQDAVATAKTAYINTTTIDNWLNALLLTDLSTVDLDDVRGQMIDYILLLKSLLITLPV